MKDLSEKNNPAAQPAKEPRELQRPQDGPQGLQRPQDGLQGQRKSQDGPREAGERQGGRLRRAAALLAVVLLASLYLVTLILAVLGDERSLRLLRFCFGLTIFLPLFLWVVIWCVGYLRHKKSMASLNILNSNPAERAAMEEAVAREAEAGRKRKSAAEK